MCRHYTVEQGWGNRYPGQENRSYPKCRLKKHRANLRCHSERKDCSDYQPGEEGVRDEEYLCSKENP